MDSVQSLAQENEIPATQPDLCQPKAEGLAPMEVGPQTLGEDDSNTEGLEQPLPDHGFLTRADQDQEFPNTKKGNRGQKRAPKAKAKAKANAKGLSKAKAKAAARKGKPTKKDKVTPPSENAALPAKKRGRPPKVAKAEGPDDAHSQAVAAKSKRATAAKSKPDHPNKCARVPVRQDFSYSSIVVYWSRNHLGLKLKATGKQALMLSVVLEESEGG